MPVLQQFLHEERVPSRQAVQRSGGRGIETRADRGQRRGRGRQWLQGNALASRGRQHGQRRVQRMPGRAWIVAQAGDDEQRQQRQPAADELQPVGTALVDPVQVLDDQHVHPVGAPRATRQALQQAVEVARLVGHARIARRKMVHVTTMNEAEAIEQMELLGHTFFVFFNDTTGGVNVVYKRSAGDYGLLIPQEV